MVSLIFINNFYIVNAARLTDDQRKVGWQYLNEGDTISIDLAYPERSLCRVVDAYIS